MKPQQEAHPLIEAMHMLDRAVRILFDDRDPELARSMAVELACNTSQRNGMLDPVLAWDSPNRTDRGLGRARRLQRLINSPVAHTDHPQVLQHHTSDYLFAAIMNLFHRIPLSEDAHLFRLWYLATRAVDPPKNALRLFGSLRQLPMHQQLAQGNRLLAIIAPDPRPTSPRQMPHAVALPLSRTLASVVR